MPYLDTIKKVLIANRGEIAVRVISTLKKMGIESAVVYHAADAESLAVQEADEAYEVTGPSPVAAYLDSQQIIDIAKKIGADALHPGYGFLSENAAFAGAVDQAGIIFIGPRAESIQLMGDKIISRNFAAEQGVPLIPSVTEEDDPENFVTKALDIGFPLLLKASAGGGGKGMQIVRSAEEFQDKYEVARNEAQRYFGDGRLFCERYLERPRHIEVQIMADSHGNVLHLGERECSVQRRFQKIIEESPSPALNEESRQKICQSALDLAKAANYLNAGTVEFIMGQDGQYYFLEMNTRLQVEHPVTEEVTGIDLVAQQVRVAAGEALSIKQEDITQTGHSIEVRIYAEDADNDFTPATGKILAMKVPNWEGCRFDTGLLDGQDVTANFDPMLAKLIVYGKDREQAIDRMSQALKELVVLGVVTNTSYLDRVVCHSAFRSGDINTGFVAEFNEELKAPEPSQSELALILSAAAIQVPNYFTTLLHTPEPARSMGRWRN